MPTVLIVDDQQRVARALAVLLELHDIDSIVADGADTARELLAAGGPSIDLVLQDMNFSPGATSGDEGRQLFRHIHAARPELPVLLMTAWASLETAVRLMREGASDYIEKPWDDHKLVVSIRDLLRPRDDERQQTEDRDQLARGEIARRFDLCGLIYRSSVMHELVSLAARVARADVPVLITGANGTGKEKLAEIVQANSPRRNAAFIRVNAGALPDSLLEAELFGAEAGAFTGAGKRRIGRFEAADRGTLLLDEIGNLSSSGQIKLLRVLQTGEFERLGSSQSRTVDVRVIAATNENLRTAIDRGDFREDLYFRLNIIELEIPALKDRPEDILPLASHFLGATTASSITTNRILGEDARRALLDYPWPGNVRELRNAMERAAIVGRSTTISSADLQLALRKGSAKPTPAHAIDSLDELDKEDREQVEIALRAAGGVVSRAARQLGLSRQALYRRMEKLGIAVERRVRD